MAAAAQGSTFISPVADLSSPHVTVGSLTAMANGGLLQPAAAAGNGITTTAAGQSTDPQLPSVALTTLFFTKALTYKNCKTRLKVAFL